MTTRQQMLAMTAAGALLALPAIALAQGTTPGANNNATGGTLAQTNPGTAAGSVAPTPMVPGSTANTAPGMAPAAPGAARDGTAANPPSTATQRAADSITGNRTPADGTPGNPPGTAAGRAVDRALGTNATGANPGGATPDGTAGNPPGTAAGRAVDRTLGTNMTGANPAAPAAGAAPAAATTGPLAVDASTLKSGHRASKLIGSAVYNENNESIGEVDDILIPAGGTGPVAVISVGGFLGIGAKLVAVPYNRLSMAANSNGRWTLAGATKDSLGSLPTFTYEAAAERRG